MSQFRKSSIFAFGAVIVSFAFAQPSAHAADVTIERISGVKPRNVVFFLIDDHRYDVMSFMDHPFVQTPAMDALAAGGVHFKNAFVTTSLCSPSRASILTGLFMHNHRVVDNNDRMDPNLATFPQYLQKAGYETAFVGKWHMGGETDEPRPGFDHWVSFRGQGQYYPPKNRRWSLNVNGQSVPQKGYITDELTDYAIEWLNDRKGDKPFMLYLSHKAVHGDFYPAERHVGRYANAPYTPPITQANTPENYRGKPMWVINQRNSWHGVDFAYHGRQDEAGGIEKLYKDYCETLLAADESVGRVMQTLKQRGLDESTLVIYMGDNGFLWGEHGLIDKRCAYEESMRVPMLAHCPEIFKPGTVVDGVVANIDIAPTILEAAGVRTPPHMDGRSFLQLAAGKLDPSQWRDFLLYEYYWEWNFPQTPSQFALRGDRYKFIQYHGVWDTDELYDLQNDPREMNNLINDPQHQRIVRQMRQRLHEILVETGGNVVPFGFKRGSGANLRRRSGSPTADFPDDVLRNKNADN